MIFVLYDNPLPSIYYFELLICWSLLFFILVILIYILMCILFCYFLKVNICQLNYHILELLFLFTSHRLLYVYQSKIKAFILSKLELCQYLFSEHQIFLIKLVCCHCICDIFKLIFIWLDLCLNIILYKSQ